LLSGHQLLEQGHRAQGELAGRSWFGLCFGVRLQALGRLLTVGDVDRALEGRVGGTTLIGEPNRKLRRVVFAADLHDERVGTRRQDQLDPCTVEVMTAVGDVFQAFLAVPE
jgi:hypothetical protein